MHFERLSSGPANLDMASPARGRLVALRLHLIGRMQAWGPDGETLLPSGRKTRALLAILALAAPHAVNRARLADLLWSRREEEQARASLRQEIHRLNEMLQPLASGVLHASRDDLSLRPDCVWVDVHQVCQATSAQPAALDLITGELLDGFDGLDPALDQWLSDERDKLRASASAVAEELLLRQTEAADILVFAQRLLSIDKAHEGAWRAMMRAHAGRGERGLALQAYARCRAALAERLDAVPSPATQRLAAQIRASNPAARLPSRVPPARTMVRFGMLPLRVIGQENSGTQFSFGLAEQVTAALARFRWLSLASSSSLAESGTREEDVLRNQHELDFLLDGSVHYRNERLRVSVRLLDLRERQIIWASCLDRQSDDLLTLQDDIAAEIAAQIEAEIMLAESRRIGWASNRQGTAYELTLEALSLMFRLGSDDFAAAGKLLAEAVALEPDYPAAHAWRGYWLMLCVSQGWDAGSPGLQAAASRHAERAITLDPQDGRWLAIAGHLRAFLDRQPYQALELHARALSLNPNLAMGWSLSALACTYAGEHEEAQRRFARYDRLAPNDVNPFREAGKILLEFCRGDLAAAIRVGRRVSELAPAFSGGLRHYLAALGLSGQPADARAVLNRLLHIEPGFTMQAAERRSALLRTSDRQRYFEGLRLAGVPEG